ncbi:MAG: glycosyltransferase family 2 protein [Bacteroidaceae bacterium]|nr:glycosyltransferase family 2 protein [Bacteroidaceae bacterium]
MHPQSIRTALIISTYNRPAALHKVLQAVARQTRLPDIVAIGDDGSTDETRQLIDRLRPTMPFLLLHEWQEDKGFRPAGARNKAFAAALKEGAEYFIQIDGDIVPERHFVADHLSHARPGQYIRGYRGRLSKKETDSYLSEEKFRFRHPHNYKAWQRCVRLPFKIPCQPHKSYVEGCNVSFWAADIRAINGYDETFQGWGQEDDDLLERLSMAGCQRRDVKYRCCCVHLWHHEEPRDRFKQNFRHREDNVASGNFRTEHGLDQYL